MTVSPHVRAALLLLVALVLVLTGAHVATSPAAAAPTGDDAAGKAGTLIDFGRKNGRAVLPWTDQDIPRAPASFRRFARAELNRIWRDELGHTPACRTSPVITLDTLRTDGFALGDVATRPRRHCETGGGYIAIWAVRKGGWRQVIGTQEVVECGRLERYDIPAELGIDQCYQDGELVPYTHARHAKPVAGTRCSEFPADNWWHADVSGLPVHAWSTAWLSQMSTDVDLHPDFGPSYGDGPNYGIPITVVGKKHEKRKVSFDYASESDRVRYPVGRDTRIEGGRHSDGDRHAIIVDRSRCRLYELFALSKSGGRWHAGSGAVWSLKKNKLRPDGWTSADAAGLPILPGLLRWNEVKKNRIDHAIRFTVPETSRHYLWPARHQAGSTDSLDYPPMGARFRLAASYDASGLSPYAQHVVAAMKKYGLVLADNGSPWFFQGEQNAAWPDRLIEDLKTIPADQFVAVDTSSLMVHPDSAQVR